MVRTAGRAGQRGAGAHAGLTDLLLIGGAMTLDVRMPIGTFFALVA